jgi:hypothetical protein
MAQQNETSSIVCRRCGVPNQDHASAYDAIRNGWRLRRIAGALDAKDLEWVCLGCAQSDRPPSRAEAAPALRGAPRRSG